MSPRRGNLASQLSLFSYQVIAGCCSPKCSSVSTDSSWGERGAGKMWCLNLGSFLNRCVWGAPLVIGWDATVRSVSNVLASTHTGCAPAWPGLPMLSSRATWMHSTLWDAAWLETLRKRCSFSLRLPTALRSFGKCPVACSAAKDLRKCCVNAGSRQRRVSWWPLFQAGFPSLSQG